MEARKYFVKIHFYKVSSSIWIELVESLMFKMMGKSVNRQAVKVEGWDFFFQGSITNIPN